MRNKLQKFHYFIQHISLKHSKICFYMRYICGCVKSLTAQEQHVDIKMIKVRSIQTNKLDSLCPEVFLSFGKQSEMLYTALLDSGAMANLLSLKLVQQLGFEKDIK